MKGNYYQKHVNNICFIKYMFLFKYPVISTMLFSKSLWTHFIRLTFFDKFDVVHGVRSFLATSLILGSLLGKVSGDPSINLGAPLIFFQTPLLY